MLNGSEKIKLLSNIRDLSCRQTLLWQWLFILGSQSCEAASRARHCPQCRMPLCGRRIRCTWMEVRPARCIFAAAVCMRKPCQPYNVDCESRIVIQDAHCRSLPLRDGSRCTLSIASVVIRFTMHLVDRFRWETVQNAHFRSLPLWDGSECTLSIASVVRCSLCSEYFFQDWWCGIIVNFGIGCRA